MTTGQNNRMSVKQNIKYSLKDAVLSFRWDELEFVDVDVSDCLESFDEINDRSSFPCDGYYFTILPKRQIIERVLRKDP